ncbi:MAG: M23 family metallopeptidase [Angustibacter sp.]
MSAKGGKVALVIALLSPLVLLTMLVSLLLFSTGTQAEASCNPTGPAREIDPAQVPKGPIAGFSGEQLVNAAHIMSAASVLGLTVRDQQIGVMTAIGESTLRVLDYGDARGPDSRGLFQQRANGAWGSEADRMDPFRSATNFFKVEKNIPDRATLEPTLVAHRVQRNLDPLHYRKFWEPAVAVVAALSGKLPTAAQPAPAAASRYELGPVQPHTAMAANTLGEKFNIATIGGYREGNTRDREGHPKGLALDFMVPMNAAGKKTGSELAAYAQTNAASLSVAYIIWYQRIWSVDRASEGWRPMADRGDATQNHLDHVHISFRDISTAEACPSRGSGAWVAPTKGRISSDFGTREDPVTGQTRMHNGTDFAAACGEPIMAASAGTVVSVESSSSYGNLLTLDHGGGVTSRYAHMSDSGIFVTAGATVTAGQKIAAIGNNGKSTGCHLHFELKVNGEFVDPEAFFAEQDAPLPP